jgi:RimJ/RimL family protein N-acetyltransferase
MAPVPTPDQAPPIAGPLGNITTERLSLHAFQRVDLEELSEVFAQPEVWRFPFGRGFSREETEQFLTAQMEHWRTLGFGLWAARLRSDGRLLGFVGLSVPTFWPEVLPAVEVGWRLSPGEWGKGYATEGASAALDEAFTTLGLDTVCSIPQSDNPPSVRVAERLGMELLQEVAIPPNDRRGPVRALLYQINRDSWLSRP